MAAKIERRFLVTDENWAVGQRILYSQIIEQAYLSFDKDRTVRVRIVEGNHGFITIKGLKDNGSGPEFEYEIPLVDAREIFENLALKPVVRKIRHTIEYEDYIWEVDVFTEPKAMIIAEVELRDTREKVLIPKWCNKEITMEFSYTNSVITEQSDKI